MPVKRSYSLVTICTASLDASKRSWYPAGVVEKVTRMDQQGLMLVATDDAIYLITATDFDAPIE